MGVKHVGSGMSQAVYKGTHYWMTGCLKVMICIRQVTDSCLNWKSDEHIYSVQKSVPADTIQFCHNKKTAKLLQKMGLKFPKPHYHTKFTFNYILHEQYETQLFQSQISGPLYWHPKHMCPAAKSIQMPQNFSYSLLHASQPVFSFCWKCIHLATWP